MNKNFNNADYYLENNDYEKSFMTQEEAINDGYRLSQIVAIHSKLLVPDDYGIYIPQHFVKNYKLEKWNLAKDDENIKCLLDGPENNEWYWEAWEIICEKAFFIDEFKNTWKLYQSGDLFCQLLIEYQE